MFRITRPKGTVMTGEFSSGGGSPRDGEMEGCSEMPSEGQSTRIGKIDTKMCFGNGPGGVIHDGSTETEICSSGRGGSKILRTLKKTESFSDLVGDIGVVGPGVDGNNERTASVRSSWRIGVGLDQEPYFETGGVVGRSTEMSDDGGRRSSIGKF